MKSFEAIMQNPANRLKLENQACFPLYSATNAVIRAYRPLLDALDLTYAQYLVMMLLWEQKTMNVKELGGRLHLDSGTLTPLLKRLETKGLVVRKRGAEDERVRQIHLTAAGETLRKQAEKVPAELFCKLDMEIEEIAELKRLCEKLLSKLSKD